MNVLSLLLGIVSLLSFQIIVYYAIIPSEKREFRIEWILRLYRERISSYIFILFAVLSFSIYTISNMIAWRKTVDIISSLEKTDAVTFWPDLINIIYGILSLFTPLILIVIWLLFLCIKLFLDIDYMKSRKSEYRSNNEPKL